MLSIERWYKVEENFFEIMEVYLYGVLFKQPRIDLIIKQRELGYYLVQTSIKEVDEEVTKVNLITTVNGVLELHVQLHKVLRLQDNGFYEI